MTGGRRMGEACVWLSLVVGVTFLGVQAYRGVEKTTELITPDSIAGTRAAYRNYECLDEAFRASVPVGAKVYLDLDGVFAFTALSPAFPDREVVGSPEEADVVFGLRDPSHWNACAPDAFKTVRGGSGP